MNDTGASPMSHVRGIMTGAASPCRNDDGGKKMTDERRFSPELRDRLVELLGPDGALELMERVPQAPWNEIATKADLADMATKSDLTREIAVLRAEMADQLRELSLRMTTTMVTTMLGGIFSAAGLAFAAAKLS
jgi:hypothetical protein